MTLTEEVYALDGLDPRSRRVMRRAATLARRLEEHTGILRDEVLGETPPDEWDQDRLAATVRRAPEDMLTTETFIREHEGYSGERLRRAIVDLRHRRECLLLVQTAWMRQSVQEELPERLVNRLRNEQVNSRQEELDRLVVRLARRVAGSRSPRARQQWKERLLAVLEAVPEHSLSSQLDFDHTHTR